MPKEDWIVLDSSDWTVEQTVHAVLARIGATHSIVLAFAEKRSR